MYASFDAVRTFIGNEIREEKEEIENFTESENEEEEAKNTQYGRNIGLSYQINIILPETENISVFNSIFKSLKENLLK